MIFSATRPVVAGSGFTIRPKDMEGVGAGGWRAGRHRPRDDRRLRPAWDRLINESVRHVNRIQGRAMTHAKRVELLTNFESVKCCCAIVTPRGPFPGARDVPRKCRRLAKSRQRSFPLREFGSTQQLRGAVDTKAHEPLARSVACRLPQYPGNALTEIDTLPERFEIDAPQHGADHRRWDRHKGESDHQGSIANKDRDEPTPRRYGKAATPVWKRVCGECSNQQKDRMLTMLRRSPVMIKRTHRQRHRRSWYFDSRRRGFRYLFYRGTSSSLLMHDGPAIIPSRPHAR